MKKFFCGKTDRSIFLGVIQDGKNGINIDYISKTKTGGKISFSNWKIKTYKNRIDQDLKNLIGKLELNQVMSLDWIF